MSATKDGKDYPVDVSLVPTDGEPVLRFSLPRIRQKWEVSLVELFTSLFGEAPSKAEPLTTDASLLLTQLEGVIMTNPHHLPEVNQSALDGIRRLVDMEEFDGPTLAETAEV